MKTFVVVFLVAAALAGCSSYQGVVMTEGHNISAGIKTPSTGGAIQLQLLTYISGFNIGVDRNAALHVTYDIYEKHSYFYGLVTTYIKKRAKAKVEPCENQDLPK